MAPLSGSDNDHTLAQPVPGVGVIHTITVDDTTHGKNYFDVTAVGRCGHLSGLIVRII